MIENLFTIKKLKTKIKSYGDEATDFHDKEMSNAGDNHICSAVIMIDSARKREENCYLHVFLKEFKCIEIVVIKHIPEDIEIFSSDSDEE